MSKVQSVFRCRQSVDWLVEFKWVKTLYLSQGSQNAEAHRWIIILWELYTTLWGFTWQYIVPYTSSNRCLMAYCVLLTDWVMKLHNWSIKVDWVTGLMVDWPLLFSILIFFPGWFGKIKQCCQLYTFIPSHFSDQSSNISYFLLCCLVRVRSVRCKVGMQLGKIRVRVGRCMGKT